VREGEGPILLNVPEAGKVRPGTRKKVSFQPTKEELRAYPEVLGIQDVFAEIFYVGEYNQNVGVRLILKGKATVLRPKASRSMVFAFHNEAELSLDYGEPRYSTYPISAEGTTDLKKPFLDLLYDCLDDRLRTVKVKRTKDGIQVVE